MAIRYSAVIGMAVALAACQSTNRPIGPTTQFASTKAVLDKAGDAFWREIPADDLMLIDLANGRRVTIQLAPRFAPVHVANIKTFARARHWDGSSIYRVQDGFVVQWGRNDDGRKFPEGIVEKPPAEYSLPLPISAITPLGYADAFTRNPGFYDGWPVSYEASDGTAALAHCYATVGAGRDLAPDTGVGVELYAVIGQAPRRLERNIAAVGRVIDGFDAMTALPRGTEGGLGLYKDEEMEVPIKSVRLASMLPSRERPRYEAMATANPYFRDYLVARANNTNEFYDKAAGAVDLCGLPSMTRKVEKK